MPQKKISYFNCTGVFPHIGCLAVTDSHLRELLNCGYDVFKIYTSLDTKFLRDKERSASLGKAITSPFKAVIEESDAVVINAEGSIHHAGGRDLLAIAELAQELGTPCFIVNAVMQDIEGYDDVLQKCADITVRELKSFEYLSAKNIHCRLVLDSILDAHFQDTATQNYAERLIFTDWQAQRDHDVGKTMLAYMQNHSDKNIAFMPFAHWSYAVNNEWAHSVANLRSAELMVTGRHHAVYIAGLAGVPFVALPSNTHKIEGTIACSKLPIPLCDNYLDLEKSIIYARENPSLYKEFQAFLTSHKGLATFDILRSEITTTPSENADARYTDIMADIHQKSRDFSVEEPLNNAKIRFKHKKDIEQSKEKTSEIAMLKKFISAEQYNDNFIDHAGTKSIVQKTNKLIEEGAITEAKELIEKECIKNPNNQTVLYTLARAEIHDGNIKRGLELMHHRSHINLYYPKTSFHPNTPVWDGTPTKEKVIIWSSLGPGIGTEVFMYGLLTEIFKIQKNTIVTCDPRLLETMRRTFPKNKFCGYQDIGKNGRNLIKHQCSLWSLPSIYIKTTGNDMIPSMSSYLKTNTERSTKFREKYHNQTQSKAPLIGISWYTPNQKTAYKRVLNDEELLQLTMQKNATFVSLQHAAEELPIYGHESIIFDPDINPLTDLEGLLHQIAAMDYIVTIDNSIAYIAGALGIKTFVLVPATNIWTWEIITAHPDIMENITVVQQEESGDWSGCIDHVISALAK